MSTKTATQKLTNISRVDSGGLTVLFCRVGTFSKRLYVKEKTYILYLHTYTHWRVPTHWEHFHTHCRLLICKKKKNNQTHIFLLTVFACHHEYTPILKLFIHDSVHAQKQTRLPPRESALCRSEDVNRIELERARAGGREDARETRRGPEEALMKGRRRGRNQREQRRRGKLHQPPDVFCRAANHVIWQSAAFSFRRKKNKTLFNDN